ncbi:hypothetical protein [Halobacillus yeomjeoni]|uniref:Sin domain-containing protein n=1 Tax=Halobacillus yeomjeoni TaxID=311194 RepID=A0A931HTR2_9BACI|nr:hypothetical protein [Halobacillus yeomjeoni]MBH0229204.1 hypothetical protein [Halobacillus yeomjeoni]
MSVENLTPDWVEVVKTAMDSDRTKEEFQQYLDSRKECSSESSRDREHI